MVIVILAPPLGIPEHVRPVPWPTPIATTPILLQPTPNSPTQGQLLAALPTEVTVALTTTVAAPKQPAAVPSTPTSKHPLLAQIDPATSLGTVAVQALSLAMISQSQLAAEYQAITAPIAQSTANVRQTAQMELRPHYTLTVVGHTQVPAKLANSFPPYDTLECR